LYFIFFLFQHPVAWAIKTLQQIMGGFTPEPETPDIDLTPGKTPEIEVTVTDYAINIPDLTTVFQWALVILTIGFLIFLIVRIIMRLKPQKMDNYVEICSGSEIIDVDITLFQRGFDKKEGSYGCAITCFDLYVTIILTGPGFHVIQTATF
jgi:hypothetical protein